MREIGGAGLGRAGKRCAIGKARPAPCFDAQQVIPAARSGQQGLQCRRRVLAGVKRKLGLGPKESAGFDLIHLGGSAGACNLNRKTDAATPVFETILLRRAAVLDPV